jgi:hypothetical protein
MGPAVRIRAKRRDRHRVTRHLDRLGRRAHEGAHVDLVIRLGYPGPQVLVEAGHQVRHQRRRRRYRQADKTPAELFAPDLPRVTLRNVAVADVVEDPS